MHVVSRVSLSRMSPCLLNLSKKTQPPEQVLVCLGRFFARAMCKALKKKSYCRQEKGPRQLAVALWFDEDQEE